MSEYGGSTNIKWKHTGIPQEQEIPAPVTTTIFLLFATESEISERVRLVGESVCKESRLRVTVIIGCIAVDGEGEKVRIQL
jgi:hypothetical protein